MEISLCSLCKAGTMKMLCIRENISSHRRENLLFLSCNMASVQNRYQASTAGDQILDFVKSVSTKSVCIRESWQTSLRSVCTHDFGQD